MDIFNFNPRIVKPSIGQTPSRQYEDRADVDAIEPSFFQPDDLLGMGLGKAAMLPFRQALKAMTDVSRQQLVKETKPVFQKAMQNVQNDTMQETTSMIPTRMLRHFREYDRAAAPREGRQAYEELVGKIGSEGIHTPTVLTYYPKENKALLTEGNHRLAAAQQLGIEHMPVQVFTSREAAPAAASPLANKVDWGGQHIPQDLKPTDIGLSGFDLNDFYKLYREAKHGH